MLIKRLAGVKDRLKRTRYFTYMFISYWKMLVFFSCMLLFLYFNGLNPGTLFSDFNRYGYDCSTVLYQSVLSQNTALRYREWEREREVHKI